MQPTTITIENLLTKITDDTLVICKNSALMHFIKNAKQKFMHKQKICCYQDINIYPLNIWLQKIFHQSQLNAIGTPLTLLTKNQEKTIWLNIIKKNHPKILNAPGLAKNLEQALQEINLTQINIESDLIKKNCYSRFINYIQDFLKICAANNFIIQNELINYVSNVVKNNLNIKTKKIIFLGNFIFDNALKNLIQNLQDCTINIEIFTDIFENAKSIAPQSYKIPCDNIKDEIKAAATWVKKITIKKSISATCYVPNLSEHYLIVKNIFTDILKNKNFIINIKSSLYDEPIIFLNFLIIKLAIDKLTINELSFILNSNLITRDINLQSEYAILSVVLKKTTQKIFTKNNLISFLKTYKTQLPILNYLESLQLEGAKENYAVICDNVSSIIKNNNFIDKNSLTMRSNQALLALKKIILELKIFNNIFTKTNYTDFFNQLATLVKENIFTLNNKNTNIKILDFVDFSGVVTNNTWICGANNENLITTTKSNPFINKKMQQELNIKKYSSEYQHENNKNFINNFILTDTIFSYSIYMNDIHIAPSAFINSIPAITLQNLNINIEDKINNNIDINYVTDINTPITENETITGGSSIFKLQSHCPFKAFAKIRLKADGTDTNDYLLEKALRGNVIHKALELIWQQLESQQNLLKKTKEEIEGLVATSVTNAIKKNYQIIEFNDQLEIEKICISKIILNFLETEKNRAPFTVVSCESMREEIMHDIKIKLRIDRIDTLSTGKQILIDYKTGNVSRLNFFSDRPEDPQLPLYAITNKENIAAISYARLNAEKSFYSGVAEYENIAPNIKSIEKIIAENAETTWELQLNKWKETLHNLLLNFKNGVAHVAPKNIDTCNKCDLHGLCRIKEKKF